MGNELQVMRLNIAICDDEKVIREQIKELAEIEMPAYVPDYMRRGMRCLPPRSSLTLCSLTYRWREQTGLKRRKGSGRGSITLNNGGYVYLAKEKYGEFVKAYMRYLRNGVGADG